MSKSQNQASALAALKPGDRVQVFSVNGSRIGQPKGGWDGIVVKVGRKLIYVDHPGSHKGPGGQAFRLDDDGRANDDYGHEWIMTVEQAAQSQRRDEVIEDLRACGLELTRRAEIDTDTLEAVLAVLNHTKSSKGN